MKKAIALALLLLTTPAFSELASNPDGYIGGLTVDLGAEATPQQGWGYTTSRHYTSSNPMAVPDSQLDANIKDTLSALGVNADLKYPVTSSLTLSLGGSYSYQVLNTKEDYEQTVYLGTAAHQDGATSFDSSHGIYTVHAAVRYYFKPF